MYAKDYFAEANIQADPGLCFVLMPFAAASDRTWETVRSTVANPPFNMLCRRADDIARPGHIMSDVLENIGRARLVIADLTGQNPNVFYELGIAHSVKEAVQVIMLAAVVDEIPFDLRHLRTIIHTNDHDVLRQRLSQVLGELNVRQYDLVLREGQSGRVPARLTGHDHCLYDLQITVNFLGEDGVKFELERVRYAAGADPQSIPKTGHYLGADRPAIMIPDMPWALCYSRPDAEHARFIVGRPPGWEEPLRNG